jgi:hypothetical protein
MVFEIDGRLISRQAPAAGGAGPLASGSGYRKTPVIKDRGLTIILNEARSGVLNF